MVDRFARWIGVISQRWVAQRNGRLLLVLEVHGRKETTTMSIKEQLEQQLQNKLEEWKAKAKKAEADAEARRTAAKVEQGEAELQKEAAQQVQKLQKKIEEGEKRLAELRKASTDQLDGIKEKLRGFLS